MGHMQFMATERSDIIHFQFIIMNQCRYKKNVNTYIHTYIYIYIYIYIHTHTFSVRLRILHLFTSLCQHLLFLSFYVSLLYQYIFIYVWKVVAKKISRLKLYLPRQK